MISFADQMRRPNEETKNSYGKAKKQAEVERRRTQANTAGPY